MVRSQQPVFQKPELPDFLRRLRENDEATTKLPERPMTDAPAREDELPVPINASEEDIRQLRTSHGLPVVEQESPSLTQPKSSTRIRSAKVEVGSGKSAARGKQIKTADDKADSPGINTEKARIEKVAKKKRIALSFE